VEDHKVLGVAALATPEEITAAYRRLAREFHPDRHPSASREERTRQEAAMAQINAAYSAMRRHAEANRPRADPESSSLLGPPELTSVCEICGHTPTLASAFAFQAGLLASRRCYTMRSRLCGACALAVGRTYQDRTLRGGWGGPATSLGNVKLIVENTRGLRRAAGLESPRRVAGVRAHLTRPMPPGEPVLLRSSFWFVVLCVLFATVGTLLGARHLVTGSETGSGEQLLSRFAIGQCLAGTEHVVAVRCSLPHRAQIAARVAEPGDCPDAAPLFLQVAERVWCARASATTDTAQEAVPAGGVAN
jgi:hypothetical protein